MRYLHAMVRVRDLEKSLDFYCGKLGLEEVYRYDNEKGKFTNVFLKAPDDDVGAPPKEKRMGMSGAIAPVLELTYNWPARRSLGVGGESEEYTVGRNFGHLAYEVDDIYGFCDKLQKEGVIINRPPRDGRMAFVRSPDGISIEILQKGEALPPQEPWQSTENTGTW
ncbi:MAG: VOC family protein [Patescibacteria group bacterium]|nr:VOC family protein [bacterium]MDZ4227204.1 VOC family protein [Patescibacteria group bacterium]